MNVLQRFPARHEILATYFNKSGTVSSPNRKGVMEILDEFEKGQRHDSFYIYFDIKTARIKRVGKNIRNVLGIHDLSYEGWCQLIHPGFAKIYFEFAQAAYQASFKYKDLLVQKASSYAINVPILRSLKQGHKEYWLIKQTAYPIEFDECRQMVSLVCTYNLIGKFEKYTPMRPFVFFDVENQKQIECEIIQTAQKNVFSLFFHELKNRYQKVLIAYWKQYTKHKRGLADLPNSKTIAELLKKSQQTIKDYNKVLLDEARTVFPIAEFSNIQSVVSFLFDLFGEIELE